MYGISLRIYFLANLAVVVLFSGSMLFTNYNQAAELEWLFLGFVAGFFSFLFSFPVPFLVWGLLYLIKGWKLQGAGAWTVFLIGAGIASLIPAFLMGACFGPGMLNWVLPLSLGSAAAGILLQCRSLHRLFKTFYHETI